MLRTKPGEMMSGKIVRGVIVPGFSILEELKWRELLFQVSDEEGFRNLTDNAQQAVYAGFDPTADSLHIGHIVPLIALRRFQLAGHTPIALVGGGTGLIGDPSGKANERTLNELQTVEMYSDRLRAQIEKFLDFSAGACSAKLLNNYEWIGALSAVEYLRDLGKYFTINWMLAKDSVKSRLDRDTSGLSYTEFSYMILQAYDFLYLAENHGCRIQLGGSDQWGNMTAGTELIRRKNGSDAYIVTVPLITTASGAKFGKTEGGAIWLDPEKTSPYAFYQYWINVADQDAVRFLKYFTFMDRERIGGLDEDMKKDPDNRPAQKALAYEMTMMVHGKSAADEVIAASEALFGKGELEAISLPVLEAAVSAAPSLEVDAAGAIPALDQLLPDLTLCASKSEAKKLILSGGVYVNNNRVADIKYRPEASQLLHGKLMIIRKGKKHYAIVKVK
jgi:tyrosyl-tRNA synthetase